jgi:hypothetical protein
MGISGAESNFLQACICLKEQLLRELIARVLGWIDSPWNKIYSPDQIGAVIFIGAPKKGRVFDRNSRFANLKPGARVQMKPRKRGSPRGFLSLF